MDEMVVILKKSTAGLGLIEKVRMLKVSVLNKIPQISSAGSPS